MGQQDDILTARPNAAQGKNGADSASATLAELLSHLTVNSASVINPILEANRMVEGVLHDNGFASIANTKIAGTPAKIFMTTDQDTAIILVDDILIPEKLSAGGASLANVGNTILPILILPHPSEELVKDSIAAAALSGKSEHLTVILESLNPQARREALAHELEHLADFSNGSPWGKIAVTTKFYNLAGPGATAPDHLKDLVLPTTPNEVESAAATLVMELKGFRHNSQSEPERAKVALAACERIQAALEHSDQAAIREALTRFQQALSTSKAEYNVGDSRAVNLAAQWVLQHGEL